jgi:hypothetical protein
VTSLLSFSIFPINLANRMASGGLTVKVKVEALRPTHDLSISKTPQPSHFMRWQ